MTIPTAVPVADVITATATGPDASTSGFPRCASNSTEGEATITFFANDDLGNVETPKTIVVRLDKTPPTLNFGTPFPPPNAAGWNNTDVSIPCTPADALSGVASLSPACPLLLTAEGPAITGTLTVTDKAGNTATFTSPAVRIDKTGPKDSRRSGDSFRPWRHAYLANGHAGHQPGRGRHDVPFSRPRAPISLGTARHPRTSLFRRLPRRLRSASVSAG